MLIKGNHQLPYKCETVKWKWLLKHLKVRVADVWGWRRWKSKHDIPVPTCRGQYTHAQLRCCRCGSVTKNDISQVWAENSEEMFHLICGERLRECPAHKLSVTEDDGWRRPPRPGWLWWSRRSETGGLVFHWSPSRRVSGPMGPEHRVWTVGQQVLEGSSLLRVKGKQQKKKSWRATWPRLKGGGHLMRSDLMLLQDHEVQPGRTSAWAWRPEDGPERSYQMTQTLILFVTTNKEEENRWKNPCCSHHEQSELSRGALAQLKAPVICWEPQYEEEPSPPQCPRCGLHLTLSLSLDT